MSTVDDIEALLVSSTCRKLAQNRLTDCLVFIRSIQTRPAAPYTPAALGHLHMLINLHNEKRFQSAIDYRIASFCWTTLVEWLEAHPDANKIHAKLEAVKVAGGGYFSQNAQGNDSGAS